jgi:hypothetical protein
MVQSAERLRAMLAALDTDLAHQCAYLVLHHDTSLLRTTWGGYQPGFTLDLQSVVFALAIGVALWAIFLGVWHGLAALAGAVARGRSRRPPHVPPRRTEPRLR